MSKSIYGIQQIGIGISNLEESWKWYRENLGFDIRIFDDIGSADLMKRYTGDKIHSRRAVLALNMQGGGGLEIWQFISKKPVSASFEIMAGDLGIFCAKIKTKNIKKAFDAFKKSQINILSGIEINPIGEKHFFIKDPNGNIFEVIENIYFFQNTSSKVGGICGAIIGVSDIEQSINFYKNILGYTNILYRGESNYKDFNGLPGGKANFKRVILEKGEASTGPFSAMFIPGRLELIETKDRDPNKIFKDRTWGDIGFIHLCFDVTNMDEIKNILKDNCSDFTIDSNIENGKNEQSFKMGDAGGRFTYIEDPDGTLIEFVESHKIPVFKKFNLYINLKKRKTSKPLPAFIIKMFAFNRIK